MGALELFGEVKDPFDGRNYTNAGVDAYFRNGTLTIDDYDTNDGKLKRDVYKYTYHIINKIPFLFLESGKKYLSLSSEDILLLYSEDNTIPLYNGLFPMKPCVLFSDYKLEATSSYSG